MILTNLSISYLYFT